MRIGLFALLFVMPMVSGCATLTPPYREDIVEMSKDTSNQLGKIITTLNTHATEEVSYAAVEDYFVSALTDMDTVKAITASRVAPKMKTPLAGFSSDAADTCWKRIDEQRAGWSSHGRAARLLGLQAVRDVCLQVGELESYYKR